MSQQTSQAPREALADIIVRAAHGFLRDEVGEERHSQIPWDELPPLANAVADAILAAMEAWGYAVVPLEPTPEMIDAGWDSGGGDIPRSWLATPYRAMLAARPR
jgi:hypothetical protein